MWLISLVDEIQFMLINSRHMYIRSISSFNLAVIHAREFLVGVVDAFLLFFSSHPVQRFFRLDNPPQPYESLEASQVKQTGVCLIWRLYLPMTGQKKLDTFLFTSG